MLIPSFLLRTTVALLLKSLSNNHFKVDFIESAPLLLGTFFVSFIKKTVKNLAVSIKRHTFATAYDK